jgi:hypothetical protein
LAKKFRLRCFHFISPLSVLIALAFNGRACFKKFKQ